jgi:hypothetical protein
MHLPFCPLIVRDDPEEIGRRGKKKKDTEEMKEFRNFELADPAVTGKYEYMNPFRSKLLCSGYAVYNPQDPTPHGRRSFTKFFVQLLFEP